MPKLLIFAGAPLSDSLDWSPSVLLDHFTEPIARLAGLHVVGNINRDLSSVSLDGLGHAVWRSLPLERKRLATDFSQQADLGLGAGRFHANPNFFNTSHGSFEDGTTSFSNLTDDGSREQENSILSQFHERSLAAHNDIPSSQLDAISSQETSSFLTNDTTSFVSNSTQDGSFSRVDGQAPPLPPPLCAGGTAAHLSDLEDIPSAAYLMSIQPQTMTVNIIAGVINIQPERTVRTRWGGTRSLVEILVGDETRSGFGVTFWLPPSGGKNPLEGLRVQDIVLMRNVALGSFMGKVYGHSLRRDLTKIHLLHRRRLDADDVGGHYSTSDLAVLGSSSSRSKTTEAATPANSPHPQLLKAKRVREWVVKFVGNGVAPPGGRKRKRGGAGRAWDMPPPDETQ